MPKAKNALRYIRVHELDITQQEMADILGVTQQQLSKYENNIVQPSIALALEFAKKLNRPVEKIFRLL
ncbi:helix-turn-helix domain-containing protein [Desulfosporosinus sp. PR]|uniref:helix-turn-helix transcriptional regulator n=1 Tax=Candidatus Desulfosporosinus nitrosoreducens TaxID=3401928 RepID=UPI0027FFD061|nr:helix-turn-helix domain-containing protein [Desulfosporosinus sp. PR]MDQ7094278.1 helix-turn-helix domain-containing protein [Desulfosporosinus sp. PR]